MFKKLIFSVGFCSFALLAFISCQPSGQQTEADIEAIRELTVSWKTAFEAGDVAGVLDLYSDDIVRMHPNSPASKGKQPLEEALKGAFEKFTIEAVWPVVGTEEIIVSGDWAFHSSDFIEKFTPKDGGEQFEISGRLVEICQKQSDGSWKFAREIWNSNSPPAN